MINAEILSLYRMGHLLWASLSDLVTYLSLMCWRWLRRSLSLRWATRPAYSSSRFLCYVIRFSLVSSLFIGSSLSLSSDSFLSTSLPYGARLWLVTGIQITTEKHRMSFPETVDEILDVSEDEGRLSDFNTTKPCHLSSFDCSFSGVCFSRRRFNGRYTDTSK